MSRQIDLSKPLSERDEAHLRQLGRTDLIAQLAAGGEDSSVTAGPRQLDGEGTSLEDVPNTGDVNTLQREAGAVGGPEDQSPESTDDEYGELTVSQLQDELERRDLPTSGKKAELQQRLRDDDAADDEDDDEDDES